MKKETIFTICMTIFILISCVIMSSADENEEVDSFRGAAIDLMTETEQSGQPLEFYTRKTNKTPEGIYAGDYEFVLKDNLGDKFYLNKNKKSGVKYLYRGYWSSKWAGGLIEPVMAVYNSSTTTMTITAIFKENIILGYTLVQSSSNNNMFNGSYSYVFKNYEHYRDSVYSAYVGVEKGIFQPLSTVGPIYNTP